MVLRRTPNQVGAPLVGGEGLPDLRLLDGMAFGELPPEVCGEVQFMGALFGCHV